eukprot:XP_017952686.1 PREDICTED: interferon-induced very large GTPase 1-like [Xenopus tropicalis]
MDPAAGTIERLIERLTEIYSEDSLCATLVPNSFLTIDPDKDLHIGRAESPKERAERLLNYVLQRGDADYRKLLDQLETLRPRFPALSGVLERERKRHTLIGIIKQHKHSKLTLRDILDIGEENMAQCGPKSIQDLPLTLLRKLAALERTARDTLLLESDTVSRGEETMDDIFGVDAEDHVSNSINSLDVLCVLLNCSDLFLQQEIFSKMSLCQFAVPLLLPAGDGPECTFMLWAMRDIVRSWRPQASAGSRAFTEESLVNIPMPLFSFVRLGQSKLSKSKILNQVFSPTQQYNDFFIHENMAGGNIDRQLSNGLVEISWSFPVGKQTPLNFPEPIAVTNMHGNLELNKSQLAFLMQVSAAVFVFAENINERESETLSHSLGIEHFLGEMGQFYESEYSMVKTKQISPTRQFTDLPKVAADLLLDGFPLELMDGDASNIPMQWVTGILTELDNKTGGKCRMRVISVLGVQSTGKSTLLNTMFGLQFPVASGRCTRGAFMTLINVKENLVKNLGCEFVLVIDTEGLKAPELASLEDSYEHDNELATLVVGLSDITITNIAGENSVDMKDILQIVVHAFLRMKTIREKPKCQFVHQNVSDVSANDKNMRDRTKILEQLNEMTRTAANMEKISGITGFHDIMDYNLDLDSWYIPGLWYGVPPMASVSSGYSENVYELKKHLFEFMEKAKSIRQPHNIGDFIEWIKGLWNSVKHENFIFSFRNSLVAEAYNHLAMKYSQWEWDFRKEVQTWLISTENSMKNQSADKLQPGLCVGYKDYLNILLCEEEKKMLDNLERYFESKSNNVHLIERYRADFSQDVKCLRKEMAQSATVKVDDVFRIQTQKYQLQDIQNNYQRTIEENVTSLLEKFRRNKDHPGDQEVKDTFESMWERTLSELPRNPLEKRNISQEMLQEIRIDMANRGSSINEKILRVKDLGEFGKKEFKVTESHVDIRWYSLIERAKERYTKEFNDKIHALASFLIRSCSEYVTEKVNTKGDFDRTYCRELLHKISSRLSEKEFQNLHFTHGFELDIKLHILGNAAPRFQVMHDTFLRENDPVLCLQNLKPHYQLLFKIIFKKKDETQSRTRQFCELCLKPAIMKHIFQHIGNDIVDDILDSRNGTEYRSRTFFQFSVLKKLLEQQDFSQFVLYINSYQWFVKRWIIDHILDRYSDGQKLEKLQVNILTRICKDIREVLHSQVLLNRTSVSDFVTQFCLMLESKLVIPQEAIKVIVFQNNTDIEQFSRDIEEFLTDTEKAMESELKSYRTEYVLFNASVKPEEELFKKVFGCGKQCPFCKAPCEAGGDHHEEHFASIHRPQGLGRCTSSYYINLLHSFLEMYLHIHYSYRIQWGVDRRKPLSPSQRAKLETLSTDICSIQVKFGTRFSNADTAWRWHYYSEYRTVYPDWLIQPDPSITASDYWKFIFAKFNEEFAKEYEAKPGDVPDTWLQITEEQALQSLREVYGYK